jgi:hypothetical protein
LLDKTFKKLIWSQIAKHKGKIYLCKMCLNSFHSEKNGKPQNLLQQTQVCKNKNPKTKRKYPTV